MDDDVETDGDANVAYSMKRSCPLYEGRMDVVTQYVRYGVSDALPWSAYDNCKFYAFVFFVLTFFFLVGVLKPEFGA